MPTQYHRTRAPGQGDGVNVRGQHFPNTQAFLNSELYRQIRREDREKEARKAANDQHALDVLGQKSKIATRPWMQLY